MGINVHDLLSSLPQHTPPSKLHHKSQRIIGFNATLNLRYTKPIALGESLDTPHMAAALDSRAGDVAQIKIAQ